MLQYVWSDKQECCENILLLIKEALPELAREVGWFQPAEDQTPPEHYPETIGATVAYLKDMLKVQPDGTAWRKVILSNSDQ